MGHTNPMKERKPLTWFMSPYRNKFYQWYHGYERVRIVKCDPEVKQKYLEWVRTNTI